MPNIRTSFNRLNILHLEDSPQDHVLVVREFEKAGMAVMMHRVDQLDKFTEALMHTPYDLILADFRLAGFTAMDAWEKMQALHIRLPFVLLSGAIGESLAVQSILAGMSDYLAKEDLTKIGHVVQRAIKAHQILLAKEHSDAELAQSEQQLANFARHLQSTIEQERAAIAREIHDDVGGSLAAIRFDLSWIERHSTDNETLRHLQSAVDMLQHAMGATQRITMNLRPAILDQGLVAAIQWLQTSFTQRNGIHANLQVGPPTQALSKNIELTVFRTAQEALTNISKHAQCTEVNISLSSDSNYISLEIIDNGRGMTYPLRAGQGGFGLSGLKERAKTAGGWLDISSTPGKGTSITLMIPLTPSNPPPKQAKP